jgi:ubiquinol-cytochrome c reductase iron-sulfur subunit
MASDSTTAPDTSRRDFLIYAGVGATAVGAALAAWPFIDSFEPAADTIAAGAPIDIDLSHIDAGQQVVVLWRSTPIFVVHRTPEALKTLTDPALLSILSDPKSEVKQQPAYAMNDHRSAKPEYAILVGICTHLGCIPKYMPTPSATDPAPDWKGGYFCPCHGSKYDLAGRVFRGVPAPYNLPVPPYTFVNDTTVRIGENPAGVQFDLGSVVQM